MNEVIIFSTFTIWLIYFWFTSESAIRELNQVESSKYLIWLKENNQKTLNVFLLGLVLIYVFFLQYDNDFVNKLLFFSINLFLYINFIYEERKQKKNTIAYKEYILVLLLLVIFITLPFIYYFLTKNIGFTYLIMFIYSFFAYFIVVIVKIIAKIIKVKPKTKKNSKK